jgi:glucokinase
VSGVAVGVDVGGTKILALALGEDDRVLDTERVDTPHVKERPPGTSVAGAVLRAVRALADRNDWRDGELRVGIGLPGMMSLDGELAFAPNLITANGARIVDVLRDRAPGLAVACGNDADCAAIAEHRLGAARGVNDMVMVTLGTGIGGGIISGGALVRGRSGFAGEIGHMIVEANGPRCPCGRRGCWERYASGAGIARLAREAAAAGRLPTLVARRNDDPDAVRGEDVTRAAAEGLAEALAVIDEVGWWLALGVANLSGILDCGLVVIGGGLAEATTLLLPAASSHLDPLIEGVGSRPKVALVAAHFAERAGAIGAALVARERLP